MEEGCISKTQVIPCDVVPVFVGLTIATFVVAFCSACYALYINIHTMQPHVTDLDNKKRAIAKKASLILEPETPQQESPLMGRVNEVNNGELDLDVSVDSVIDRCKIIVKFGDGIKLKRNYRFLVFSNI